MGLLSDLRKAKSRRGMKFVEARKAKIIENDKAALIVKGGKTSETVTNVLSELYDLKKPLVQRLRRKNAFHPFEDDTNLEKFAEKFDSSLFLFGSNSKKHPNCLIFGRMYDYHMLDMVELCVENLVKSSAFNVQKAALGSKPCVILQGSAFETPEFRRIGNLMVDWFRGVVVENINFQGIECVLSLTAVNDRILFRIYRNNLKKSTNDSPFVELVESGPRIDFRVGRMKLASEDLFKTALKKPKELKVKKQKNKSEDVFGSNLATIHIQKQNVSGIQTRKVKGLRK